MRLQDYLAEVTKIVLLEPAAEKELWLQYKKQADLDSRRQLIIDRPVRAVRSEEHEVCTGETLSAP